MIIPSWFGFIFNFCNLALICPQTIRDSKLGELIWKGGNELKLLTNLIISTYCFLFHNISCSPWGRKELDTTEQLNSNNLCVCLWNMLHTIFISSKHSIFTLARLICRISIKWYTKIFCKEDLFLSRIHKK